MEQGLSQDFEAYVRETLRLEPVDAGSYSPLALAFIGDGVYELVIRTIVISRGNRQTAKLHRETSALVKAGAQAQIARALAGELTEREQAVYRRGRNAKPHTMAKNASVEEYLEATGLEALIGYLYLSGEYRRLVWLIEAGLERTGMCEREVRGQE